MNESAEADGAPAPTGEGGLGARLNRLMQAAEAEAAQVREAAERRAAALHWLQPTMLVVGASRGVRRIGSTSCVRGGGC
jgi:hypothetical protein